MRAKGHKLKAEDVVKLMLEEEVGAKQAEVKAHFAKMEVERGFKTLDGLDIVSRPKDKDDDGNEKDREGGEGVILPLKSKRPRLE